MNNHVSALILAAGCGSRMNTSITKQKIVLSDKSVLERAVAAFDAAESVSEIIVVCREDEIDFAKAVTSAYSKVKKILPGGSIRAESAAIGFSMVSDTAGYVAIHDAARCLITQKDIEAVIKDAYKYGAATASCAVYDSVKVVDNDGFISESVKRSSVRLVQTPQVFRCDWYREALERVDITDPLITDDNSLLERIGKRVYCTDTSRTNVKITESGDIDYAKFLLRGESGND